ncbi:uncharacterized protein STEHIDRAFT_107732 [Stereum hirsutum FP-91666 SS1]|uniref:uncharacterized protein n=1 Tax=Stereum hirsutum (strain FP-91666) TaxID=721885 RepID=UPI000440D077|nr:uncharacterized protein STEHIDRAFT_107732 [Stereum hirsutum FP-91666 SS1]EIM91102.1 hypothetical protein STEHIDRAFT_107732 [Stereum hirsutum FP-91666 SS1]
MTLTVTLSLVQGHLGIFSILSDSCDILYTVQTTMIILAAIAANLILALRVYAICGQNQLIIQAASVMLAVRVCVGIWQATLERGDSTKSTQYADFSQCSISIRNQRLYARPLICTETLPSSKSSIIVTGVLPMIFDTFIFAMTVFKTYRHLLEMRKHGQKSITEVLLRDAYPRRSLLSIVFTVAVANLALLLPPSETWLQLGEVLSGYFSVLTNLLINRLYLNIRALNHSRSTKFSREDGVPRPISVGNRFLGNIGAPLDPEWWDIRFDDDELELSDEVAEANPEDSVASAELGNGATTLIPVIYHGDGTDDIEMYIIYQQDINHDLRIFGPLNEKDGLVPSIGLKLPVGSFEFFSRKGRLGRGLLSISTIAHSLVRNATSVPRDGSRNLVSKIVRTYFIINWVGLGDNKASGTAFIFLVNRYSYGVGLILELVTGSPGSASDKRGVSTTGSQFGLFSMCSSIALNALLYERSTIVTAVLPLLFDTFVFGVTVLKTYRHAIQMYKNGRNSITDILLRDVASVNLALELVRVS